MTIVALLAITILALWGAAAFNTLVRLRNQLRTAWADIDVQLQRRHDLVPQLVEAVKGYAAHERATLEAVTELRAHALSARGAASQGTAETALEQALGRLIALREAYPELKASENFAQLSSALVTVEEHLQYARRFYNGAVRDYNDATQRLPDLLIARSFGFSAAEFFQADDGSRAAPAVALAP
ncbi:LemA family protein [Thermomonas paludicola]|uniref:LemA family protein n=1 Tax=Thermomonas paludicola TaxID=2884874 RepID=UPI002114F258|nr:LemA family protein [Thermomonas paludicola]